MSEINVFDQFDPPTLDEEEEKKKEEANAFDQFDKIVDATPVGWLNKTTSRFGPDMFEAAEDTANMISNPVDTAKAAAEAVANLFKGGQRGLVNKATEGIKRVVEDPGIVADAVAEHPFDTAMMLHGGGVSQGIRPIASTIKGAKNVAGKAGRAAYRSDMGIPQSLMEHGDEMVDFGARNSITGTRKGMERLEKSQGAAGTEMRGVVQDYADGLPAVPRSIIEKDLKDLRASYKGDYNEVSAVSAVNKKIAELQRLPKIMTAEAAHDFKISAYQDAAYKTSRGKKGRPKEQTARTAANSVNQYLRRRMPDYEPLNYAWGRYEDLRPFVKQRMDKVTEPLGIPGVDMLKSVLTKMKPGARVGSLITKMSEKSLRNLYRDYTPPQVRYMLDKVSIDSTAASLWAAGQFDQLLEEDEIAESY